METTKSSVQITQELLALVNACRDYLGKGEQQSRVPEEDPVIRQLLDELSLSGDAVSATVDRSDPYFTSDHHDNQLFRQAVSRLRDQAGEISKNLQQVFDKLLQ